MGLEYFNERQGAEIEMFIRLVVQDEFSKLSLLYKREEERLESAEYVDTMTICKHFNVSRQTINNWEKGKVSQFDISPFVKKQGKFKFYNLKGIISVRKELEYKAERSGSTKFFKQKVSGLLETKECKVL